MIEVFETGAVFRIEDLASANLGLIADKLAALDDAMLKVEGSLTRLSRLAGTTSAEISKAFTGMGADINPVFTDIAAKATKSFEDMAGAARAAARSSIESMREMSAAIDGMMSKAATASAENAGMGMRGRAARHANDDINLHGGRVGGNVAGAHVSAGGGLLPLAAAGIVLDAGIQAAELDDTITKGLLTGGIPIDGSVSSTDAAKRLRGLVESTSRKTGYDLHDSGEAVLDLQRVLQQLPFEERQSLIEKVLPNAALEARLKGSTLKEGGEAIVGIGHQTGVYDPAGIEKIGKDLAFTSTLTPQSLPQFQKALGYALPELSNGLGMDPSTIMLLTATMQQAGIGSSKSGTWLRSFFENSEPGDDKHNAALQKLGMLDTSGNMTWRVKGADGKVDWAASVGKLSEILQNDAKTIDPDERFRLTKQAYGERGGAFASLMMNPRFTENLASAEKQMGERGGGNDLLQQYATGSPLQQARLTMADFNVELAKFGETLMPEATKAMKEVDAALSALDKIQLPDWLKALNNSGSKLHDLLTGGGDHKNELPQSPQDKYREMQNPLLHKSAFMDGDGVMSGDVSTISQGVYGGMLMYANGGAGASGGTGGSSIVNAAYTTSGGGSGGRGDGSPVLGGSGVVDRTLPPEARAFLDTIASGEAHGYNVLNGGGTFGDMSRHPGGRAAGRYQDLPSTWRRISSALGLKDFSPTSQDKGNWWLAQQDYHAHTGRNLLPDLESHDPDRIAAIGRALHSTWVSTNGSFAGRYQHFMGAHPAGPAPRPAEQPQVHTHNISVMLDGHKVGQTVVHNMVAGMTRPSSIGTADPRAAYLGPGTLMTDAA